MDCPFDGKYPTNYISDGTRDGFYGYGSVWDFSDHFNARSSKHYSYRICRGVPIVAEEGNWDEPPFIEPFEQEEIIIRPRIKRL